MLHLFVCGMDMAKAGCHAVFPGATDISRKKKDIPFIRSSPSHGNGRSLTRLPTLILSDCSEAGKCWQIFTDLHSCLVAV